MRLTAIINLVGGLDTADPPTMNLKETGEKGREKYNMLQILLGVWKNKIKLIEDDSLFRGISVTALVTFFIAVTIGEIYLMNNSEFLIVTLVNVFLVIYNKPTILCSVAQRGNLPFMVRRKTILRFFLFHILRENALLAVFTAIHVVILPYSILIGAGAMIFATGALAIDIYLWDIYSGVRKFFLSLFIFGVILCIARYNIWILLLVSGINLWYLHETGYSEMRNSIFSNHNRDVFISEKKITICRVNWLFFLRMSLQEMLEFILEFTAICIARYFIESELVFYLFIAIFLVDIELVQDDKMKNYDNYYGKTQFFNFARIAHIKKFALSAEFHYVIKYGILSLPILIIEIILHSINPYFVFAYINILILIPGISFRYYLATEYALKERKLVEHTWFRMAVLYLILLDLAPFIFEKVLLNTNGYHPLYGCLFTACVTVLLLFLRIENMVKVAGRSIGEETL